MTLHRQLHGGWFHVSQIYQIFKYIKGPLFGCGLFACQSNVTTMSAHLRRSLNREAHFPHIWLLLLIHCKWAKTMYSFVSISQCTRRHYVQVSKINVFNGSTRLLNTSFKVIIANTTDTRTYFWSPIEAPLVVNMSLVTLSPLLRCNLCLRAIMCF